MTQLKHNLYLGFVVSILGLMMGIQLGAAEPQAEKAKWDNLKEELSPGQEIKVVLNDAKAYRGRVVNVSDEEIKVSLVTGDVSFARQDILRVSAKGESHRGRNAAIGAAIGFGSGFPMADAGYCSGSSQRGKCVAIAGSLIGILFAGAGAGVGAAIPTGGWHDVYRLTKTSEERSGETRLNAPVPDARANSGD